jgi:hypothetical protein
MHYSARILWACHVWLTAAMTLVAGLPHFQCLCPNGRVKALCLSLAPKPSGCCCGGACCSSAQSSAGSCCAHNAKAAEPQAEASCCGQPKRQPTEKLPGAGFHAAGTGCVKTPVRAEPRALPKGDTEPGQLLIPDASLPGHTPVTHALPATAHASTFWHGHSLAPPPDLVIVLQHFLI